MTCVKSRRLSGSMAVFAVLLALVAAGAHAVKSPTSSGSVVMLDEPVFRIPATGNPPVIDGDMEEGEWEDASALSGFWYHPLDFLAPIQLQLQVYAMYDEEHLYMAYRIPQYPPGAWHRVRGRFPNVLDHQRYGIMHDDHIELELRPFHDIARGYQLGVFAWIINPINTVADYYWSLWHGKQLRWNSEVKVASSLDGFYWTLEMAIPHKSLIYGFYDGQDAEGNDIVSIPPPDGTVYRCWFASGIGREGPVFNAFDAHMRNTTKTKMIFDSNAVAFQINELGPIMEDVIDVHITVKNHGDRSQSMRLGFFVENYDGMIYSSYEDEELTDGVLELIPGEVRRLRLRHPSPGITERGNVLWFDVRTAGRPARPVFMTRLIDFHSHGVERHYLAPDKSFHEAEVEIIEELRTPR